MDVATPEGSLVDCDSTGGSLKSLDKKLSHKKWRALLKKKKRQTKRQVLAQQNPEPVKKDSSDENDSLLEERAEQQRRQEHALWLIREEEAQQEWKAKKDAAEREKKRLKEEQERIKKEWEEQQKKEEEEKAEQLRKETEKKEKQVTPIIQPMWMALTTWLWQPMRISLTTRSWQQAVILGLPQLFFPYEVHDHWQIWRSFTVENTSQSQFRMVFMDREVEQDALLHEATSGEKKKGDGPWHNPLAPVVKERVIEDCPFFKRTGACRFGERCSRGHPRPDLSCTLLIPNMYASFGLGQAFSDDYDTDLSLEFEEGDFYNQFREFYMDVLPEFKKLGRVVQFKVCCNCEPHLRGNVYVQYDRESDAEAAFARFNGRWYGGRQLNCEFTNIQKWRMAICGMFHQRKCPKGKTCNFLHVFNNPGNEFRDADLDRFNSGWTGDLRDYRSSSHYSNHDRGRYDRWRDRRHERGASEHSRYRDERGGSERRFKEDRSYRRRSLSRSRSRSRSRSPSSRKKRSHSKASHRSRSRSPSQRPKTCISRSKSKSPQRKRLRSLARSKSKSPQRNRSRSKSKSPLRRKPRSSRSKSRSPRRKFDSRSRSRSKSSQSMSQSLGSPSHRSESRPKSKTRSPLRESQLQQKSPSLSPDNLHSSSDPSLSQLPNKGDKGSCNSKEPLSSSNGSRECNRIMKDFADGSSQSDVCSFSVDRMKERESTNEQSEFIVNECSLKSHDLHSPIQDLGRDRSVSPSVNPLEKDKHHKHKKKKKKKHKSKSSKKSRSKSPSPSS